MAACYRCIVGFCGQSTSFLFGVRWRGSDGGSRQRDTKVSLCTRIPRGRLFRPSSHNTSGLQPYGGHEHLYWKPYTSNNARNHKQAKAYSAHVVQVQSTEYLQRRGADPESWRTWMSATLVRQTKDVPTPRSDALTDTSCDVQQRDGDGANCSCQRFGADGTVRGVLAKGPH